MIIYQRKKEIAYILCLNNQFNFPSFVFLSSQDILPELEASNHAEALTYLLLLLKTEEPTNELIRLLLSRETKNRGDSFVTSALRLVNFNLFIFHFIIICFYL